MLAPKLFLDAWKKVETLHIKFVVETEALILSYFAALQSLMKNILRQHESNLVLYKFCLCIVIRLETDCESRESKYGLFFIHP